MPLGLDEEATMYAVYVTLKLDPDRWEEAEEMLHSFAVPMISQGPGFVRGTWVRAEDGTRGHSLLLYENEEMARGAAERAGVGPPPGSPITFESAEVVEVVATAPTS
jgi:hypothetical protein